MTSSQDGWKEWPNSETASEGPKQGGAFTPSIVCRKAFSLMYRWIGRVKQDVGLHWGQPDAFEKA